VKVTTQHSGGSNLGPLSRKLSDQVKERAEAYRAENSLPPGTKIPADAVTASGSGLDPHIGIRNAELQAARVGRARGLAEDEIMKYIAKFSERPDLGIFGEPRVNVLELNLALDARKASRCPRQGLSFLQLIRARSVASSRFISVWAGVGKTWQMLLEGHRLRREGVDVVVGLVETHGRADTAELIEGLEIVPRKQVLYRGITLEEMDLDAVQARKPEVALVDELAHTNVPGSENPKRYQDVQDLLASGIHVITTLNIQHLESLFDTVEKFVGSGA